ncbi:hypothetical protein BC833DRAFT_249765 [Globomyces pollinis-pini]|nr:hypothetical protein BC833DRAFT_249765 [Globomyces pollinis-pini]
MDSNPTTTTTSSSHPINEIINNLNNQDLLLFNLQSLTELLSISNEFHLLSTNYNNLISSLIQILSNYQNNAEIYLLACRSLSTTIDIFPLAILPFIHKNGLIPLKNLLLNTMYLDLADHILKPILKISFDFPRDILNANLLFPSLQYCDFFDLHLQRTAFQILSNVTSSLHSFTQNGMFSLFH